jgi:hypothetical protein
VALWLPTAWELAVGHDARVDALLARVFAPETATLDNAAAASAQAARGGQMLRAWLQRLGVELDPARLGITDAAQRVQAALGSVRGRNFVGACGTVAAD